MRCCTISEAIIVDQTFVVLIVNNISVEIIVFLTINEGFVIEFSGLKDDFLLDVSGLLALMGILFPETPSLSSTSGLEDFSRLVFLVYFLEAAFGFFMPNDVTVGTPLRKVWAIICIVASRSLAQLTKNRGCRSGTVCALWLQNATEKI